MCACQFFLNFEFVISLEAVKLSSICLLSTCVPSIVKAWIVAFWVESSQRWFPRHWGPPANRYSVLSKVLKMANCRYGVVLLFEEQGNPTYKNRLYPQKRQNVHTRTHVTNECANARPFDTVLRNQLTKVQIINCTINVSNDAFFPQTQRTFSI